MTKATLLLLFLWVLNPVLAQESQEEQNPQDTTASDKLSLQRWTTHRLESSDIMRLPFRGLDNYFTLVPGAVQVNGDLHIRGSRPYETGYLLDGFNVANPFFGSNGIFLIPEATEAIEVHTGAFGAELGSATGGIVAAAMRTGGERLEFSADIRTDDVVRPGSRFLNTTPFGYKNFVGTVGGPLPALDGMEIRFFLAGEHTFYRNRQAMFLEPFRYDSLTDDGFYRSTNLGLELPSSVEFNRDWIPDNWLKRTSLQGNASLEYEGIRLKLLGSYNEQENLEGREWPFVLTDYFNQNRSMLRRETTKFGAAEIGYKFSPLVSAKASVYFYDRYERTFDRDFKHNWFIYADSAENARFYDTSQWLNRYTKPDIYSTIYAFHFTAPNTPNNTYSKNRQSNVGVSLDLHVDPTPELALNVGMKFDSWKMRQFEVNNISNLRTFLDNNYDGIENATFASDYERRIRYMNQGMISNYGYTYTGTETDGYQVDGAPAGAVLDRPYKPIFSSVYATARLKAADVNLEAGLRYEYFEPNFRKLDPTLNPAAGHFDGGYDWSAYNNPDYNVALGIIDESHIQETEPVAVFLPRLGVQFIASDNTSFFAGYGRYAHMPPFELLYLSSYRFSRAIAPDERSSYGGKVSFAVRPELSTHFEFGVIHNVSPNLTVSATLFRNTLVGQIQLDQMFDGAGEPMFTLYRNNGQGVSKGIELGINLARTRGFEFSARYALSSSQGFTSHPESNARQVTDDPLPVDPLAMYPYDYDQAHRISGVASYRIDDENNLVFDGWEITGVLTFNSGHPFTREEEVKNVNPYGAWDVGVKSIRDVRFVAAVEPPNQSSTPTYFNVDLRVSKRMKIAPLAVTIFVNVLNLLNTKNAINVYPTTGTPNDDSWFSSPYENRDFSGIPNYESFYRDINLRNRWAYSLFSGNDMYGAPRQIQFGMKVEM